MPESTPDWVRNIWAVSHTPLCFQDAMAALTVLYMHYVAYTEETAVDGDSHIRICDLNSALRSSITAGVNTALGMGLYRRPAPMTYRTISLLNDLGMVELIRAISDADGHLDEIQRRNVVDSLIVGTDALEMLRTMTLGADAGDLHLVWTGLRDYTQRLALSSPMALLYLRSDVMQIASRGFSEEAYIVEDDLPGDTILIDVDRAVKEALYFHTQKVSEFLNGQSIDALNEAIASLRSMEDFLSSPERRPLPTSDRVQFDLGTNLGSILADIAEALDKGNLSASRYCDTLEQHAKSIAVMLVLPSAPDRRYVINLPYSVSMLVTHHTETATRKEQEKNIVTFLTTHRDDLRNSEMARLCRTGSAALREMHAGQAARESTSEVARYSAAALSSSLLHHFLARALAISEPTTSIAVGAAAGLIERIVLSTLSPTRKGRP